MSDVAVVTRGAERWDMSTVARGAGALAGAGAGARRARRGKAERHGGAGRDAGHRLADGTAIVAWLASLVKRARAEFFLANYSSRAVSGVTAYSCRAQLMRRAEVPWRRVKRNLRPPARVVLSVLVFSVPSVPSVRSVFHTVAACPSGSREPGPRLRDSGRNRVMIRIERSKRIERTVRT